MKIKGATTVITGAARGIGRALALRFAQQGAKLALTDVGHTDLESSVAACF